MRHSLFRYLCILSCVLFFVKGQLLRYIGDNSEIIRDPKTVGDDWAHLEEILKNTTKDAVKMMMPMLMEPTNGINISSTCIRDGMQVIAGMRKLKSWAMRFLDSSAKMVDGALSGTLAAFGAFDECLDTVVVNQHSGKYKGKVMFTGKYCLLNIALHLSPKKRNHKALDIVDGLQDIYQRDTVLSDVANFSGLMYYANLRLGLCVPSGCSPEDINQLFSSLADYTRLYMKVRRCQVKEEKKYTPMMIFVMTIYSFAGFMVLLGSSTDIYLEYSGKKADSIFIRLILSFSLIANFRKLTDTSTSSQKLSCLNGVRFITMSWIVLCHSCLLGATRAFGGLRYILKLSQEDITRQVLTNGFMAVDTFFFIGGFLVCYLLTKHIIIARRRFSILGYIIHRLWRILPLLTFVVLYVFIIELTATGPIAHDVFHPVIEDCRDNWWGTLLFINNFYRTENACLLYTWYLAADMQLYIASLIILLPLLRWPKVGISIAFVLLLVSIVTTAADIYVKHFPPVLLTNTDPQIIEAYLSQHFFRTYKHAGPYIIGLLAGYFLAMNPDLKIPRVVQLLGWFCAISAALSVVYGPFEWARGREPTVWEAVLYVGCYNIAWALSIAWMIICCATGHGGIVNYILSWKLWIPLGRLTYAVYLVHMLFLVSTLATIRHTFAPMDNIATWLFLGVLMGSYGIAFVASMLIESPFLALEKLFLIPKFEEEWNRSEKDAVNGIEKKKTETPKFSINLDASELHKGKENEVMCRL